MASSSFLDTAIRMLMQEAENTERDTGRGKGGKDKYDERVGISKGLRRAVDVVREAARAVNADDD